MADEQVRTSKIVKSIERVINLGNYESLRIHCGVEETIEWKDQAERDKKVENWNKLLIQDFKKTEKMAMASLGAAESKATLRSNGVESKMVVSDDLDSLE